MRTVSVLVALLAIAACGDDASPPDARVPPDASVADAAVADAAVADAAVADASEPDASPDASPPDAPPPDAAPPDASPVDAGPPPDAAGTTLTIAFVGDVTGAVGVYGNNALVRTCTATCTVALDPGVAMRLFRDTPSELGAWGGRCTGTGASCTFTIAAGANEVSTEFRRADREQWTRLMLGGVFIESADYDAQGNLILGTPRGLFKLTGAGAEIWSLPSVRGVARVDRAGDIVVVSPPNLIKVSAAGAVLWTRDAGLGAALPALVPRMGHRHATAPNGDVAVMNGSVQVWSGAGEHRWTRSLFHSRGVVAVDSTGVVHAPVEDAVSIDATRARRFASDGTALADSALLGGEYWTSLDLDADDNYVASTSGHGILDVNRISQAGQRLASTQLDTRDSDYVENGVAVDAFGHAISVYSLLDGLGPYDGFTARRIDPTGTIGWTLTRRERIAPGGWGFAVYDVAADGAGNVALVGGYASESFEGGWIQVFRFAAK